MDHEDGHPTRDDAHTTRGAVPISGQHPRSAPGSAGPHPVGRPQRRVVPLWWFGLVTIAAASFLVLWIGAWSDLDQANDRLSDIEQADSELPDLQAWGVSSSTRA